MVINDSFYIKISLNFIQHGTNIGPGSRIGGLNVVPLLASTELCVERSQVTHFCNVSVSMVDLNLAHIMKFTLHTHELPEHYLHKFRENVKSNAFTKIS